MATDFTKNKLQKILSGSLSVSENLEQHLALIEKNEGKIRAFIDVFKDDARKRAKEIDAKIKGGNGLKIFLPYGKKYLMHDFRRAEIVCI